MRRRRGRVEWPGSGYAVKRKEVKEGRLTWPSEPTRHVCDGVEEPYILSWTTLIARPRSNSRSSVCENLNVSINID